MLTRLANLDFIYENLSHLKIRFFSLSHEQAEGLDQATLFKTAYDLINETAKVRSTIEFIYF